MQLTMRILHARFVAPDQYLARNARLQPAVDIVHVDPIILVTGILNVASHTTPVLTALTRKSRS